MCNKDLHRIIKHPAVVFVNSLQQMYRETFPETAAVLKVLSETLWLQLQSKDANAY